MVTRPRAERVAPDGHHGPHPITCILPPHMLRAIAERGSPEQRAWALQVLAVSERIRGRRELLGDIAAVTAIPSEVKQRSVYDGGHGTHHRHERRRAEHGGGDVHIGRSVYCYSPS